MNTFITSLNWRAALPPDVRKASGFPSASLFLRRGEAKPRRHQNEEADRKGRAFPHIKRHSRGIRISRDRKGRAFPHIRRQSRRIKYPPIGKAKPFRTSGGRAAESISMIGRQSLSARRTAEPRTNP